MADNVTITPGSGATIAADEITDSTLGTVKVQYVKLIDGTLGGTAKASVSATFGISVTLASLLAGEDLTNNVLKVENRFTYLTINSGTTTTVKSGVGFLHRITVTGGTTGTIVIYDNTAGSGTKIADFDTTNTLASYEINVSFSTGCTIVTSAATKITVSYR